MNGKIYLITHEHPQLMKIVKKYVKQQIGLVQYRDRFSPDETFVEQANEISKVCKMNNVKIIVNDRKHLLDKLDVDGIHISFEDSEDLRKLKNEYPKHIFMVAVNEEGQAKKALERGADILSVGSIFQSPTEPDFGKAPISLLSKIKKLTTEVAAVGGISDKNINKINPTSYKWAGFSSYLMDSKNPRRALQKIKKEQSEYAIAVIERYINNVKKIIPLQGGVSSNINFKIITKNKKAYHLKLLNVELFDEGKVEFIKYYFNESLIAINKEFLIKKWVPGTHKVVCNEVFYKKLLDKLQEIHKYRAKGLKPFGLDVYDDLIYKLPKKLGKKFLLLKEKIRKYKVTTIHGDINKKNIINNNGEPHIIDFEWLSRGPEIIDYGFSYLFLGIPLKFFVENTIYNKNDMELVKEFLIIHTMLWTLRENTPKSVKLYEKLTKILEGKDGARNI